MRRFLLHVVAMLTVNPLSGQSVVTGAVLEQDSITPIVEAEISFSGISEAGDTLFYQFVSDTVGVYQAEIEAGMYQVWVSAEGYEPAFLPDSLWVGVDTTLLDVNFCLREIMYPVQYVAARHFGNDLVRISWSMHEPMLYEDFETGDFGSFPWSNAISDFPWAIDSTQAFEGDYCMKSTCEGQENGLSEIEVYVYVPMAGEMSFQSMVSSEASWDVGLFYLDGMKLLECSGSGTWEEHRFPVTEGEHLFRWSYRKDASTDEGDDCFRVDAIHFYIDEAALRDDRSFQYYELYRRRLGEEAVMLASHLTDTLFMDMNWSSLPWGKYSWGVSCSYEGNRTASDTIWSVFLDKDMTTTFELAVTTNVGLIPSGAVVTLTSSEEQGHNYSATLDANGHVSLNVYRGDYYLSIHHEGYEDYVSDEPISVFAPTHIDIEMVEKLVAVDSLYVSSTGWAMWQLSDAQSRGLQGFELMLNDVLVATTTENAYQFDEEMLEEGMHYVAQVRPVYLSGACDWVTCEWDYRSCSAFAPSANGLQWSLQDNAILLSWDYPENVSVMGAMLYRDGVYLGYFTSNSYLDEAASLEDDQMYCLRIVYDGPFDGTYFSMSCREYAIVTFPNYCDPPTKLDAENYFGSDSDYGVLVSWGDRPEPIFHWMHYDNGTYLNSVGNNGEPMFWSIRFDAEDLIDYQGAALKKVALFDAGAGSYQLWVYVGGDEAPRTLVWFQGLTLSGTYTWQEQTLSPAIEIPENEPIWIVVGQQGLARPAAACADMGNPNGRWVSLDGEHWTDMHTFNMHYTWMLRAFVTNRNGQPSALGKDGFTLQHYNLYRSYDNSDYQNIATIQAVDGQAFYQYRDVLVNTTESRFYYRLTAQYLSDDGEECESDYAASLHDPEMNYVVVDDHWSMPDNQEVEVEVYPNPANDVLFIQGRNVKSVAIFNALGQCVLTAVAGESDGLRLNLSQCVGGVYWLRIATDNGVAMRRIVVAR